MVSTRIRFPLNIASVAHRCAERTFAVENLFYVKVPDLFGKIDIISERVRITYKQGK